MLDPRIYRTGLVGIALAVIVLAFSLQDQPVAARATLAPDAYDGPYAYKLMGQLASSYPNRSPDSTSDRSLAGAVKKTLQTGNAFSVSDTTSSLRTAAGTRTVETVTGTRAGLKPGTIVIVAHRDGPGEASLSGTATLMALANVIAGETLQHTIVLASTSGSAGVAGATELAGKIGGPIDAVIALGDLAGAHASGPIVIPWSNGVNIAPPLLRNTLAASLSARAGLHADSAGLGGQFVHLAFPLTLGEQGPFGANGYPAALLSVSGERAPAAGEQLSASRMTGLGQTVVQAVSALDSGPSVPAPSAYLVFDGKVVPAWAIRLLVLALILPVLAAAVDGVARASRRGHELRPWGRSLVAAAAPFALSVLMIVGARALGVLHAAPPGPAGPGAVPIQAGGAVLLVLLALVIVGCLVLLRRSLRGARDQAGGAVGVLIVMCVAALAIWLANPFAAALVVPALHLWMWLVDPEVRIRRPLAPALLAVGLAPPVLVALYYAFTLHYSPIGLAWSGVLMVAGGHVGVVAALEWCVVLGCTVSVVVAGLRSVRAAVVQEELPVTVRGPVTYAGPGSLGGTESALRARR
jgi:hypothetical protein